LRDIVGFLRWRFPALIALMALVGISEGFSVSLLLPLLSRMGIESSGSRNLLSDWLDRAIEWISPAAGPLMLLGIVVVVATLQAALFIALNWWTTGLVRSYRRYRQSQMFSAFIRAKWTFLVDRKSGELTNAIVNESLRLSQAFSYCLYLISASVVALVYLAFAFLVAWPITATLIVVSLLMTLSVTKVYRKSMAVGRSIAPLNSELQSALGEFLSGAKIVKSSTGESRAEARVDDLARKLEHANHIASFLPNLVRALFEFLAFIFLAAILVFGKEGFGIGVGNIIVVIALFVRLFPRVSTVQVYIHPIQQYGAGTAFAFRATLFCAGKIELIAQELEQRVMRADSLRLLFAIHRDGERHRTCLLDGSLLAPHELFSSLRMRSMAVRKARRLITSSIAWR
jgi:ATP-binding cassette subfamily C protein